MRWVGGLLHATQRPPQKATAEFYLECADHDATAAANLARKKVSWAWHGLKA